MKKFLKRVYIRILLSTIVLVALFLGAGLTSPTNEPIEVVIFYTAVVLFFGIVLALIAYYFEVFKRRK